MLLDVGCKSNMIYEYAETEALNPNAMQQMKSKYGVTNRRWTDDQLGAFEKAWMEVVKESAKDATSKNLRIASMHSVKTMRSGVMLKHLSQLTLSKLSF